ncbi:hypothetical protein [Paenibacillus lautus]|jgi:hypothetical protein|uniref:DUF6199 domain-containing protein n=1 Tax=Paenibacillus lautus TaxID=1401 RepID=A0A385TIV3_PAELA|nr:hypothetical protein [Paenibacillus lautus]AYB42407.1 hypothetical protein D5F53_03540 [Paenibacillus lautus]MCI1776604.1 hypothetical protein [Paenibacillus lautus]
MFWMLIGVVIILNCRYNYMNPDSDWIRWNKRLPEDYEQDDQDLLKTQIGAAIGGFLGGVLVLIGLATLVQPGSNPMSWGTLFGFAVILIGMGLLARRFPTFGWSRDEGWKVKGDSERSHTYVDLVKFGGLISICLGSAFFVLGLIIFLMV